MVSEQFLRFALVGAAGFVVDVAAVYAIIAVLELAPIAARVPAFFVAASFTWYLNRRFTFADRACNRPISQWLRFLVVNAGGGLVNLVTSTLVLLLLGPGLAVPLIAVATGSLSGLLFNYSGSVRLVFSPRKR
jgi:putative flippase GtrA